MPLTRRKRRLIKATQVAKDTGISLRTIKGLIKKDVLKGITLTDGPTSPVYVLEAEMERYLAGRGI